MDCIQMTTPKTRLQQIILENKVFEFLLEVPFHLNTLK